MNKKNTCIVFDFDCTITVQHLFKSLYCEYYKSDICLDNKFEKFKDQFINFKENTNNKDKEFKNNFIELFFGGIDRYHKMKTFFKELISEHDDLYISSNGYQIDILKSLQLVGLV